MRTFYFFHTGNIFIFLTVIIHLIAFFAGTRIPETEAEKQFYNLLETLMINQMGIERTYDSILQGYSLLYIVSLFFFMIVNVILFKYLRTNLPLYRNIVILNILLWGIQLIVILTYLVLPTMIMTGLILGSFLTSYFLIGKTIRT